jgi:hypothetical protein
MAGSKEPDYSVLLVAQEHLIAKLDWVLNRVIKRNPPGMDGLIRSYN